MRRIGRGPFLLGAAAIATGGRVTRPTSAAETTEQRNAREPGAGVAPYGDRSIFARDASRSPPQTLDLAFTPLDRQLGIITPSGLFFTRNHSGVPRIDPTRHELLIDGLVKRPSVFTLEDLMRFPSESRVHFVECAGNTGREWQVARAESVAISHGLASCCEWTGVPLRYLFDRAQLAPQARWVLAEGADASAYDRSIPLEKLLDDALVVYGQNGEHLRPEQGFPMRLLLPGYEGSTNIKWLRRLTVGTRPWYTREETAEYTELLPGGRARAFDFVMEAKSVIAFPAAGARLSERGPYELRGFAWSGRGRITRVDVSLDGGTTWAQARLDEPALSKAFTRFTHDVRWDGRETIVASRATDETGYVQPTHERLVAARGIFSEYHNNAIQPWKITHDGRVVDTRA